MQSASLSEGDGAGESLPEDGRGGALPNDIPISLKASLIDEGGVAYRDYRKGLQPLWWRV